MSLLTISNLHKSFGDDVILNGVDLILDRGEKLALIGDNGAGKTTLFRLILGRETPDKGDIHIANGVITGYLEQHLDPLTEDKSALTDPELERLEREMRELEREIAADHTDELLRRYQRVTDQFEAMGGYDFRHRMAEILAGLGLAPETATRPLYQLSGGERMRVALARILLRKPDLLLLDEPTNHLDQDAIEWLEDDLSRYSGSLIVISHDRTFLDRVADRTGEINNGRLTVHPGNYSRFKEIEAEQRFAREREIKKLSKKLERQEEITQTMLSHRKISSYRSSQKKEDRLTRKLEDLKDRQARNSVRLTYRIVKGTTEGDPDRVLFETDGLTVTFDGRRLFQPFSAYLKGAQRVCLVGPNGCGKTTLLNALLGRVPEAEGEVRLASGMHFGYLGQIVTFDNDRVTLVDEIMRRHEHLTEGQARNLLARFGFVGDDVFKRIEVLSGGERSRLYLCSLLHENPDILFLDEPTNHLDISSREILEDALNDYDGAILAVSHDRYFIDAIAERIWGFIGDAICEFPDYRAYSRGRKRYREQAAAARPEAETTADNSEGAASERKASANAIDWGGIADLFPDVKQFPSIPKNPAGLRKLRARLNEILRELERATEELRGRIAEAEAGFGVDDSPAVYTEYAALLKQLEQHETMILEIMLLQEKTEV